MSIRRKFVLIGLLLVCGMSFSCNLGAGRVAAAKEEPPKVHVDQQDRLARDWKAVMADDDYVGAAEVTSRWPEGYGSMTVLDAGKVKK